MTEKQYSIPLYVDALKKEKKRRHTLDTLSLTIMDSDWEYASSHW